MARDLEKGQPRNAVFESPSNQSGGDHASTSEVSTAVVVVAGEDQTTNTTKEVPAGIVETRSEYLVTWDGEQDPTNPLNWPSSWKWTITIITSLGEFVTMMSGSMIAPALPQLSHDLHISEATAELVLSVILLAFAFGPLLLGPFTEIYGRRPVWIACGVWYSGWNVLCGFAQDKGTMVTARLLSGLGAAVMFVIAFPVLWDIWRPEERGKSFAISGVAPVLGPAIGPCLGAVVAQATSWRWIFWGASILNACIVGSAIILFPETSAASILGKKARKLRVQTGHPYHTAYDNAAEEKFSKKMWNSMSRPVKLLITQPILLLVSIFMAYGFGVLYIVLATFSSLYTEHYHQTTLQSGLHYLALAVGYTIAEQVGAILMDHFYDRLKAKNGNSVSPEYRVPLMVPGGLLMPIGLLWVSLKL